MGTFALIITTILLHLLGIWVFFRKPKNLPELQRGGLDFYQYQKDRINYLVCLFLFDIILGLIFYPF